ncbi:MAG: dihydrofolate reductase [Alphaproteobacteria bacterium]|nr:dihydrofolate reductase [Alphaproteobacteria bacterium]
MIRLIAIVEKNFGLSKNGKIPWEFEEDRAFFQKLTRNSVVIMGRNTFFSHKNFPLKDRINCVITKTDIPDAICFPTLEEAIKNYSDAWIIGGAQLYNYALQKDLIAEAIITQVNQEYDADTFLDTKYLESFNRKLMIKKENYCIWKWRK